MMHHRLAWILLLMFVGTARQHASTGDTFTGTLERIGNQSISIRLNDRRIVCALVSDRAPPTVDALVHLYRFGDTVAITATPITPVWEEGTSRNQYLQVTALRLIRHASTDELATMYSAIPFSEGENLLENAPDSAERAPVLPSVSLEGDARELWNRARQVNFDYVHRMPNFVADETAKRVRAAPGSTHFSTFDTLEAEIAFQGNRTIRRQIRRNGKSWSEPFESLPGFKWYGGFGGEIAPLFDAHCPVTIEPGKKRAEFRFSAPLDGCAPYFYQQYQRYNPPRTGHVSLDTESGKVVELDEEASGFPTEFQLSYRKQHIYWGEVKIGDDTHLLPIRATCEVEYFDGTRYRIEVEFKNHRHFSASSVVKFQ